MEEEGMILASEKIVAVESIIVSVSLSTDGNSNRDNLAPEVWTSDEARLLGPRQDGYIIPAR